MSQFLSDDNNNHDNDNAKALAISFFFFVRVGEGTRGRQIGEKCISLGENLLSDI